MIVKKKTFCLSLMCIAIGILIVYFSSGFSDSPVQFSLRVIVGVLFVYCIAKGIAQEEKINPFLLFSLTPLSLLIYTDKISSKYLMHLDDTTWVLAVLNISAFLVSLSFYTRKKSIDESNREIRENNEVLEDNQRKKLINHALILFLLSIIPDVCRSVLGTSFFLGSTIAYFKYPALACAWKSKSKYLLIVMYLYVLVSFATKFNKSIFLSIGIVTILCIQRYGLSGKKNEKKLYLGILFASLFMVFVAFPMKELVQGQNNFSFSNLLSSITKYYSGENNYYSKTISWNGPAVLQMPYMYLVSAWNNVQYVIQTQSEHTNGLWLFKPIISWLQLDSFFASEYSLIPYSSFNTFGFVTVLYKDFGIVGSAFGSLFLGVFVAKVFNRFRVSNSPLDLACYAMTAQATLEMFFSNHFFQLSYPFTIILICWVYKLVSKGAKEL